ncbi:MAG TPA: hypothetical protein DCR26_09395 [Porphyromonadaceae bacterium]|nr:hypothetical protein [Porphyromonadaceae bacterium]
MIRFKMDNIEVEQFAILSDGLPASGKVDFETSLGFMYSVETKRIACVFILLYSDSDSGAPLLKMALNCQFSIHPDDWNSMISDGVITIPKNLQEFLAVQTVGTSRGILFSKTEKTPFSQLILPPVNVAEMIKGAIKESLPVSQSDE